VTYCPAIAPSARYSPRTSQYSVTSKLAGVAGSTAAYLGLAHEILVDPIDISGGLLLEIRVVTDGRHLRSSRLNGNLPPRRTWEGGGQRANTAGTLGDRGFFRANSEMPNNPATMIVSPLRMNCCHGQECSAALPGSPARAGADRQPDHQPGSKLATIRALSLETASSSLGRLLTLGTIEERETYAALDWLGAQHDHVERTPSHAGRRSPCLSPSANRVTAAHHFDPISDESPRAEHL
jgi:hypothetical protein